jgi:hypothetical protein
MLRTTWWQRAEKHQATVAGIGTPMALISRRTGKEVKMADSVYKVIQLVGSSDNSWEEAAKNAVERASQSLRDLRVAEIAKLDMKVENGKVASYRARVNLSFKYGGGE